jgi:hypothetical protein
VKNQDFMGKTNYFFRTLPFSPWAVSAINMISIALELNQKNKAYKN